MDFKQLESLLLLQNTTASQKPTRELYLTQPTLSNHIQNLEASLAYCCLTVGKDIRLTDAGKTARTL